MKKKNETFFFVQVTYKEDKLVEFSWSFLVLQPRRVGVFRGRFFYWLCGEIVFTPWDLFVVYPIYYELKFSIKLYSCNLYFIVDIFRNCPVVFPSTLEGFPHKIWCSCVVVFVWCLLNFFFFFFVSIILLLLGSYIF